MLITYCRKAPKVGPSYTGSAVGNFLWCPARGQWQISTSAVDGDKSLAISTATKPLNTFLISGETGCPAQDFLWRSLFHLCLLTFWNREDFNLASNFPWLLLGSGRRGWELQRTWFWKPSMLRTLSTSIRNGLTRHSGQMFHVAPKSHGFQWVTWPGQLYGAQRDSARRADVV